MGMKPRGEDEKLPTTEGQEVPASEGTKEALVVTVEGGDLASVVTEVPAAEAEKESIVAGNEVLDPLAEALKASADPEVDRIDIYRESPDHIYALQPSGLPIDFGAPSEEELTRSIFEDGKVQNLDPEAMTDAHAGALVRAVQKSYEEVKFPDPPSHMHVMGVDLARGDDKTVASVIEDGKVRILSDAEMEAFVESAKAAFTAEIENEQIFDVGQQFPVTMKDGTIVHKFGGEPFMPKPPTARDFILTKSGRRKLAEAELEIGELPTGEYRHTVRILEGYIEGIKTQADADDLSLEDWLTRELGQALEARFHGGR
jgi:hypothetical protein